MQYKGKVEMPISDEIQHNLLLVTTIILFVIFTGGLEGPTNLPTTPIITPSV